jgi:hypothetical protein
MSDFPVIQTIAGRADRAEEAEHIHYTVYRDDVRYLLARIAELEKTQMRFIDYVHTMLLFGEDRGEEYSISLSGEQFNAYKKVMRIVGLEHTTMEYKQNE